MVIMCSSRSLLILSSMAASVVDFPEPVGPVTSNQPTWLVASALHHSGQAQRIETFDLPRNCSEDGADGTSLIEQIASETRQVF